MAGSAAVEELVGMGRSPYTGFWGNLSKEDKKTVNDLSSNRYDNEESHYQYVSNHRDRPKYLHRN